MKMVQTAIHVVLNQHLELPPAELLTIVNKTITENIELMGENKYMTINAFAIHENGKFIFAGLHQDVMIYRAKEGVVECIKSDGAWLGAISAVQGEMKNTGFELGSGDVMLLYTDGITEAWIKGSVRNERNPEDMFGENRLQQVLAASGSGHPDEVRNNILKELEGYDCDDDVTMVVLKRL